MTAPLEVADLRSRAKRLFDRDAREWAAAGGDDAVLDVPLHPPTERRALADLEATRTWVESWRVATRAPDVVVEWAVRSWSRVGSQEVPVRVTVRGARAIARIAGEAEAWALLLARLDALREIVGDNDAARRALRTHARAIAALEDADHGRLMDVLAWLRDHPVSERLIRELPIRGIHTKWIESRRGLVEALHRAGTGASGLGLREPAPLVRLRALDAELAVGGLLDVSAPVDQLAALPIEPHRVFVFENLATVLAMPDVPGGVVIHGGGHRVDMVARLPWAHRVSYWGDLDSHGFAILHRLRMSGVEATSVLMDAETAIAHRDLWGSDPEPNTAILSSLTREEASALQLLSAEGNVRLEQERIPWNYALERLGIRVAH